MTQPPSTRLADQTGDSLGANGASDDELASLPKPPRRMRTLALILMALAGMAAISMALFLASDVRYALGTAVPIDVGELSALTPTGDLRNAFVQGEGSLELGRALRYERPLEPDPFLLAPVAANQRLWVEMRAPSTLVAHALPLSTFVGRLVPVRERGFRRGVSAQPSTMSLPSGNVQGATVPSDAWVLLDGITPNSLRWTIPLLVLFVAFAGFCAFNIVRIIRPVRT